MDLGKWQELIDTIKKRGEHFRNRGRHRCPVCWAAMTTRLHPSFRCRRREARSRASSAFALTRAFDALWRAVAGRRALVTCQTSTFGRRRVGRLWRRCRWSVARHIGTIS
jgi:hypothetical protein